MSGSRKTWTDYKVLLIVHNLARVQDMQRNSRKKKAEKIFDKTAQSLISELWTSRQVSTEFSSIFRNQPPLQVCIVCIVVIF